jgi:hypothetical protein
LGRAHRFVIPASEAGALEEVIESTASLHGLALPAIDREPGPLVVATVVVVVAAIVSVLLLAAGHVISV